MAQRSTATSEFQLPLPLDFDVPQESPPEADIYPVEETPVIDVEIVDTDPGRFVFKVEEELVVRTPADAVAFLMQEVFTPFDSFEQEELYVLILNTKNRVTHFAMAYRGTLNAIYVRAGEVFRAAVRINAASIIVAHNHPSGDPTPSPEDVRFTEIIVEAGGILEIKCLDHLIIGDRHWVSLKERKLGFD